ncbi:MAG: DHA2 family efflux MFS transporter permease subunit [Candidatus Gastranaerophilaceae bacterium]
MSEQAKQINPWILLIPTMLAAFMFALDETIANIALPHIAGSFSVSSQESIWVLTSYLIASCLTIPMIDWMSRLMGRKNAFMACVLLFTVASFLCGISSSMGMMVISRFLQGLGGGVLIPIAQAIVMENFEGDELSYASTIFGLVVIIAPIIGPVLGGWITENFSWHWVFFINVPIGILILIMSVTMIVDPPYAQKQANVKTDYWGILFLCLFAVAFEVMMDKGNDLDWFASPFICKLTVIWVIALILLIISQIKQKDSLVKFDAFKDYNFVMGTICLTIMNAILLASMAMLPQFMQIMMGYDSFTSGCTMMPRGIGCLIGCLLSGLLQPKVDGRILSAIGVAILCFGSWSLGFINLEISPMSVAIPNVMYGIGMSLGMVPIITISCKTIAAERMSNASGLQNFIKTVGGAVGTSLVATFVSRFSQTHQFMLVKNLSETNPLFQERVQAYTSSFIQSTDANTALYMSKQLLYNQMLVQAKLWAYIDSFRVFALAGVVILVLIFALKNDKKQST